MTRGRHRLPRPFGRLFGWLFPTALGAEACEELEAEFSRVRERRGRPAALLWCVFQLSRPSTWALAWELRRSARRRGAGHPERVRARRGGFRGSWLDVKLGYRMLKKHPVLTLISVLSISVAVGIAAGFFILSDNFLDPTLPLDDGDRLVGVENWDVATSQPSFRMLYDLRVWRDELESIEELGAFEAIQPNLILADGRSEPVRGSRITATAFGTARVAPLLGRPLLPEDERPGAADVVVLGFEPWQRLFGGDSAVIGRTVGLGGSTHSIVGVMPAGFRFPYNDDLWVPLREELPVAPLEGPWITVLGRLREGSSIAEARAELAVLGNRMASEHSETHGSLRPRVEPFALSMWEGPTLPFSIGRVILLILLLVVCANVGALVYARNAARIPEVTLRRALGASRRRILVQLFVEAFVLSGLGAAAGVVLARWGMGILARVAATSDSGGVFQAPFWFQLELAPKTYYYVGALTLLSAVVIGLLPALKLTRHPSGTLLQSFGRGSAASPFGRVAKAAIALQVGLSVGLLAIVAGQLPGLVRLGQASAQGVSADQYLTAQLQLDRPPEDMRAAYARVWSLNGELAERLIDDPEVAAATVAGALPGMAHPQRLLEVDGRAGVGATPARVGSASPDFFTVLGAPMSAGRTFNSADVAPDGSAQPVAIVNESLARRLFRGTNAIGQRVRFVGPGPEPGPEPGPWLEIVGVVGDLGMNISEPDAPEGLYLPLTKDTRPVSIVVRTTVDPSVFESRLRSIAAAVDPSLRLLSVQPLSGIAETALMVQRWSYLGTLLATLATLALSLTGVYAVTSFLVVQRTREIGIRVALGAGPREIAVGVLTKALVPALAGMLFGVALALLLGRMLDLGMWTAVAVPGAMTVAVGLACVAPARRALSIHPTEAIQAGP